MSAVHCHTCKRPSWRTLASQFEDDRECLASFIALETAEILEGEILEGAKPANLFTVVNRRQPCGRNLYALWKTYGEELLQGSGLVPVVMIDRGSSLLLLIYSPEVLGTLLARKDTAAVLRRFGYTEPLVLETILARIQTKLRGENFPHEIGVLLGYPLKDVVGFLGWAPIPFACQGPWKIYGDPQRSLELADCFRSCRGRMAHRLASSASAIRHLRRGESLTS